MFEVEVGDSQDRAADEPVLDPVNHTASQLPMLVRDPATPRAGGHRFSRRRIGETQPSWTVRPTSTIRCSIRTDASG